MRTKTLLLTAALTAAGIASSMAQVYSVNAVGYINSTVPAGKFALLANQLTNTMGNYITNVIPTAPLNSFIYRWDPAAANFYDADVYLDAANAPDGVTPGWYNNNTGNPTDSLLKQGEAFFFQNGAETDFTITFVGEVPQGDNLAVTFGNNISFSASIVPQEIYLHETNGVQVALGLTYYSWNVAAANYNDSIVYLDAANAPDGVTPGWYNNNTGDAEVPKPAVGIGFLMDNQTGSTKSWTRSFHVN